VLVLALDTATPSVTVAVSDGAHVLAERTTGDERRHGEVLAPAIEGVLRDAGLAPADLDVVAVGVGPGPFTGLRVGLVTARTLGAVLGIPVRGVCTLDVVALGAALTGLSGSFRVATDARRKEVYWASYDGAAGGVSRVAGPFVARPADVPGDGPVVGPGAALYPDVFADARPPLRPSAAVLCRWLAEDRPTGAPDPMYLRRPDAVEPRGAGRSVLGR
jgi:tRNA threonylcarbamoyladenosine biosynthesis protein TsaB